MTDETWSPARLIPVSGIKSDGDRETRSTSALLAVMTAVPDFAKAFLAPLGAPAGRVETFIEVPFAISEDERAYPDGLIRVHGRKGSTWTALVEVKTNKNDLSTEQLEKYLGVIKTQGFDALITISNQFPSHAGVHPTSMDKRKIRNAKIHHWSWAEILATAVMLKDHRGIADLEQGWLMNELVRYLSHPNSGATDFESMGSQWVPLRQAVATGTFRAQDKGADELAGRFDALLRFAALRLTQGSGSTVLPLMSRQETNDPSHRTANLLKELHDRGTLTGGLKLVDSDVKLYLTADLRAGQVTVYSDFKAPDSKRPITRVSWLVKQLESAPGGLRIESILSRARGEAPSELLSLVRDKPEAIISADPNKEIKSFRLALICPLGTKNGTGRGTFIESILSSIDAFQDDVLASVKPWRPINRSSSHVELDADEELDAPAVFAVEEEQVESAEEEEVLAPVGPTEGWCVQDSVGHEVFAPTQSDAYLAYMRLLATEDEWREKLLEARGRIRGSIFADLADVHELERPRYTVICDGLAVNHNLPMDSASRNLGEITRVLDLTTTIEDLSVE